MSRLRHQIDTTRAHVHSLWVIVVILVMLLAFALFGWRSAPDRITLHYPPDLRAGAVLNIHEVPAPNVYAFAYYIFQQLNRWSEDGATDYGHNIYRLSPYLTPRFREQLIAKMKLKGQRGELAHRVRTVQELPGLGYEARRVAVLNERSWVVWLDLELVETVRGMRVKQPAIRYPLRVVRYAVDQETNPWGLALDGYADEGPRRLAEDEMSLVLQGPDKKAES
jgi:integrating conjugative element protein (TIGR03746 family)